VPGIRFSRSGQKDPQAKWLEAAVQGSVVGIQIEVAAMYTGTLIRDLMMTAERVVILADQQRMTEELHEIFTMQIPVTDEQAYQGAA
jgi:hypothetical protein